MLARPFDMSLPAISKHVRVLEQAGLLTREIDGRVHRIGLAPGPLSSASEWIAHYRRFWEERLNALAEFLEDTRSKEESSWPPPAPKPGPRSGSRRPSPRRSRKSSKHGPGRSSMKRWMGPSDDFTVPEASADPRVGGSYRIVMRHRDGSEHVAFGTYEEVTPPTKLVFTWSWESPNSTKDTLVTVELEARGETTLLKLTHERFPNVEARDNHQKGWTGTLDRLEAALR